MMGVAKYWDVSLLSHLLWGALAQNQSGSGKGSDTDKEATDFFFLNVFYCLPFKLRLNDVRALLEQRRMEKY